jgi:hypothetical protein
MAMRNLFVWYPKTNLSSKFTPLGKKAQTSALARMAGKFGTWFHQLGPQQMMDPPLRFQC